MLRHAAGLAVEAGARRRSGEPEPAREPGLERRGAALRAALRLRQGRAAPLQALHPIRPRLQERGGVQGPPRQLEAVPVLLRGRQRKARSPPLAAASASSTAPAAPTAAAAPAPARARGRRPRAVSAGRTGRGAQPGRAGGAGGRVVVEGCGRRGVAGDPPATLPSHLLRRRACALPRRAFGTRVCRRDEATAEDVPIYEHPSTEKATLPQPPPLPSPCSLFSRAPSQSPRTPLRPPRPLS